MSPTNSRQILRRTKPVPSELLGTLIKRVKLLPAKTQLSPLEVKSLELADDSVDRKRLATARRSLRRNLAQMPKRLQNYIWTGSASRPGKRSKKNRRDVADSIRAAVRR